MNQDSPLIECQGRNLAEPDITEYNIYDVDCIISANQSITKVVPIRLLTKSQRLKLRSHNNIQYRTNFLSDFYKNFIN